MAKRGRPKKNVDVENKTSEKIEITPEENTIEEVTPEKVEEEVAPEKSEPVQPFGSYEDLVRNNPPDSDVVGEGTLPDYNPFSQSVVEREYSTPEIASGVIEDIKEPQFIPPSYDDLVNSNAEEQAEQDGVNDSPFDNPNPAINDLDGKDKKVQFKLADIKRELPNGTNQFSRADLEANFERVYEEARSIFG